VLLKIQLSRKCDHSYEIEQTFSFYYFGLKLGCRMFHVLCMVHDMVGEATDKILAMLVHKPRSGLTPLYLPTRQCWAMSACSVGRRLHQLSSSDTVSDWCQRSFMATGPWLWHILLVDLHQHNTSLDQFQLLKTFLFP